MEEEDLLFDPEPEKNLSPIITVSVCKCLLDDVSSEKVEIPARKQHILSIVGRTESYLRERRIPELIRFLLTKVIARGSSKPIAYLETLLNDCMLFRAGHGVAPVLYEHKHLEAVVLSFDPGRRGWLSAGQIRRAYLTLGLTPNEPTDDKIPTDIVLNDLEKAQEDALLSLLLAGVADESSEESFNTFWHS